MHSLRTTRGGTYERQTRYRDANFRPMLFHRLGISFHSLAQKGFFRNLTGMLVFAHKNYRSSECSLHDFAYFRVHFFGGSPPTYMKEKEYMVLARNLIAQGRLDEATTLLQRLLEATETGGRTSRLIEVLLLQALTFQAGGDTDQAIAALGQALTLAAPRGFIRIFVDEGPPIAGLLYKALERGISPDYVRRLLAAFPVVELEKTASFSTQVPKSELIEPLSEREIEVLQLIAAGLTNRGIAARLFLPVNTVKAHTRNIYGKLDVHSRTQAVARSQELGLLPSSRG